MLPVVKPLFGRELSGMERRILAGLEAHSYEHAFDRGALATLKGTPGLEHLVREINKWGIERFLKIQYTGSNVRITADNFPEVHDILREAGKILGLSLLPELYIQEGESIDSIIAGIERPILVLNAACIDHLSPDELFFLVGHELGHIKSGHVLYHQIGDVFPILGDVVSHMTLGISGLFSNAIEVALLNWQRMSDLTADRAGLLACQNRDASISAMLKIAGLPRKFYERFNVDDFIAQAREFKALDQNPLDKVAKIVSIMGESRPWTVMRAAEFDAWTASGDYNRILEAYSSKKTDQEQSLRFCSTCGGRLIGDEAFCPACGSKVAGI
jgi:hypothetical protein